MNHDTAVSACIIDIDATITDDGAQKQHCPGHPLNNAILSVIAQLMAEHGWERSAAEEAIARFAAGKTFWDYPDIVKAFDLPEKKAWERLVRWHIESLIVYEDAVVMVKQLHAAGLPLFIVSNNPLSGCLMKLHRAGLAGLDETEYFRSIFGSNICMGQKNSAQFWDRCLNGVGFEPAQIAIIGDNFTEDCLIPRSLGVKTVFLVDRKRRTRIERSPEAFWVNTLEAAGNILLSPASKATTEFVDR